MTKAQESYDKGYTCRCHEFPPCDFCLSMTEEEADAMWNGGYEALEKLWKEKENYA